MEFSKEQTLELFLHNAKAEAFDKKFKFSTKSEWYCLHCGCKIFVSYKQSSVYSIFCTPCYGLFHRKETIVQQQYMMKLKNHQLELVEKNFDLGIINKNFQQKIENI